METGWGVPSKIAARVEAPHRHRAADRGGEERAAQARDDFPCGLLARGQDPALTPSDAGASAEVAAGAPSADDEEDAPDRVKTPVEGAAMDAARPTVAPPGEGH